jgi:hypothetical protein
MSESWKCPKCGEINTGKVGGMMFGGSFSSDMTRMKEAAEKAQKICASCGADRTSASQETSSSCFIATAVYGDSYHPSVVTLREYRDHNLYKSFIGRAFIKLYYLVSPHLIELIKHNPWIKKTIRNILDKIVKTVSKIH